MSVVADDIFDLLGKNQLPGILSSSFFLSVEQKSITWVLFTVIKVLLFSWLGPYSTAGNYTCQVTNSRGGINGN